jgi:plasmid stability protein
MSVNLSIKDVPEPLAQRLRLRAARNHRSLQGELLAIIEMAATAEGLDSPVAVAGATPVGAPSSQTGKRSWTHGWKSLEQLVAERRASGWQPDPAMAQLPRGVDILRADRDSR